jgi:MT0933-like antitoxin protein
VGILDSIKGLFGKHEEKVDDAVDKSADVADDKTGGQYTEQIDTGADKAHEVIDDLGNQDGQ